VLQSNSDWCHYELSDSSIEVTHDFLVNVEQNEVDEALSTEFIERKYNNIDYAINYDDIDTEYIEKAAKAFSEDTGIEFQVLISFLWYMKHEFSFLESNFNEIENNVIVMKRESVIEDFISCCTESIQKDDVIKTLDFLCIAPEKIKTLKGKQEVLLPTWERENRDNRFDVKPLLRVNDSIVFSPFTLKTLHSRWTSGIMEFYPPYEIGLVKLKAVLTDWKKRYEKQMVVDIAELFENLEYDYISSEVKLHSRDKTGNHPQELGDYDVIAVSKHQRAIYIIESKVLQKVGSIKEHNGQQKNFFYNDKNDEISTPYRLHG